MYLQHYVLKWTVADLAQERHLTEIAVKKAIARCKEVLPETWGHVFHGAADPVKSTATSFS
jgi:hypothetical protein